MNKKGIIALLVIVIAVAGGFFAFKKDAKAPAVSTDTTTSIPVTEVAPADVTPVTKDSTDVTLLARLKKASVGVSEDGSRVALSDGKASFTATGSSVKGTVTLGDVAIESTSGSRKDVIATVTVNNGASSVNTYVVLFEDKDGALTDKSYTLVGEGVKVSGIRTDKVADAGIDYIVSVSYSDKAGKARTKILVVEKGAFNSSKEISL